LELGQTSLETALPPIGTDKEAIKEYETVQSAGVQGESKWVKGKTSIYVDAFNLALDTVLKDEGRLFDEAELAVFKAWESLDYEAQYLYVCLVALVGPSFLIGLSSG
jgi:Fanconi-associated nuclease 1